MVTDQQVRRLRMLINTEETKAIAASKAGMDEKTARKYTKSNKLPSETKKTHDWKTRKDPFESEWLLVNNMLEENPGLEAKTIFNYLQHEYPGKYSDNQLRTLQRRIKVWRATEGPAKEIFFPQKHYPGELSASDFTHMSKLGITIQGEPFNHLLYHFTLTYSNWETGTICFSESFESLSNGLQNALWELGGVPKRHRTDRMSAAVHKDCNPEKFTKKYQSLLRYYDLEPERINSGRANENGDIEQRNSRIKKAVGQALMLRGSHDFLNQDEYQQFLFKIFEQLNAGRNERFKEEMAVLRRLPARRLDGYKALDMGVGPSSTINVLHNTYSVHSRLIGEKINIKIYSGHIEVWYAQKMVEQMPRLRGESKHRIQYRHIVEWLIRKPGAFENYRYKSDMFPSSYFRMAYDYLKKHTSQQANKEYLNILYVAFKEGESVTENAIRILLRECKDISVDAVKSIVCKNNQLPLVTEVQIDDVILSSYDELLSFNKEAAVYG